MKTFIVDSFTKQAFKGNPAGVCFPLADLTDAFMQSIAKELGFSETAFVVPAGKPAEYSIRYFSPVMEIPLCGHATLAASKVLFNECPSQTGIRFMTGQNVELRINAEDSGRIVMSFPVYDVREARVPDKLLNAVGVAQPVNCVYNSETDIILLEIESAEQLSALVPDFRAMVAAYDGIHGVLVTARSTDDDYDFHSRFFWPWSGGTEDPVTGGTHTFLAKYWAERLGKNSMRSFQSSARTGSMEVELVGENELLIKAHAKIVFEGQWKTEVPADRDPSHPPIEHERIPQTSASSAIQREN